MANDFNFSADVLLKAQEENELFKQSLMAYEFPDCLKNNDYPLTWDEESKYTKKFGNLKEHSDGDTAEFREFIGELIADRNIKIQDVKTLSYGIIKAFGQKIVLTTYDTRLVIKK